MKIDSFLIRFSMIFYDLIANNDVQTVKRRWNRLMSKIKNLANQME